MSLGTRLRRAILATWVAALAALAAPPAARAQEAANEKQIIVYNKGKVLQYDPDAGADLKEVILETYDCREGKRVKEETLETYYHLSDDKEIITPAAICEECRKLFQIEKRDDKYYFLGIRDKPATTTEEVRAAETAAPPITTAETASGLQSKVRKVAREIVKVPAGTDDASKQKSAAARNRIITSEFTHSFQGFGPAELEKIAGFVRDDDQLSPNQKYYVLRTFGLTFFERRDYEKSVFFYEKCIELQPENYSAYFQKAVAHDRAGDADGAVRAFAKALARKPQLNVARSFGSFARRGGPKGALTAEQVAELRTKVAAVETALREGDAERAREEARAVEALVDGWYAGGAPAPGGPPATPPPSPDDLDPDSPFGGD